MKKTTLEFIFWIVLALAGQAAAVQLVNAGPKLHYQHYLSFGELVTTRPYWLVVLGLQAIAVILGLFNRRHALIAWLKDNLRPWQLFIILAIFCLASAALSRSVVAYLTELIFAALLQLIMLGNVILIAWTFPQPALAKINRWVFNPGKPGRDLDYFAFVGAVWILILTAGLSYFVYQRIPHVPDEVMYLYQARYLAAGKLTLPAFPAPEAFSVYMVPFKASQWYSPTPPGWPVLLAAGMAVGIPWLVNPILAAVSVLLSYLIVRNFYGFDTARVVLLLLCTSPWFIFMGMSFMSHMFMLTTTLLACFGVVQARRSRKIVWGLIAGLAAGIVTLIRPLDGLLLIALLGLWSLGLGGKRLSTGALVTFCAGAALMGILALTYNFAITGNALKFPLNQFYETYYGPKTYALGFGPDRGITWPIDPFPGYSPLEAGINAALNTFSLNYELFGWGTGSLLLILIFIVAGKKTRLDLLFIIFILAVLASYTLFWYSGGPDFGPRYWFITLLAWIILAARGLQTLSAKLAANSQTTTEYHPRLVGAVFFLCLATVLIFIPWRAGDKYYHYLWMRPDVARLSQEAGFGKSLVFVQGQSHPDYAAAWANNPLDPASEATLFAFDKDLQTRRQAILAFPDRPVWFIAGPSITQGAYQILAGPLDSAEAQKFPAPPLFENLPANGASSP